MTAAVEPHALIAPEIVLVVGAMALLMLGVFRPENDREAETHRLARDPGRSAWRRGSSSSSRRGRQTLFDGALRDRRLRPLHEGADARRPARARCCCRSTTCARRDRRSSSIPVLVLLATAGMMMMISANDLIALYLGLELQSLALYVVAAIRRDDVRSSEAGLKYFVLGALSSGMLLYGASLIYGFTGSTSFAAIAAAAKATGAGTTSASSSAWCSCWSASPSRSRPCRSTCGRPTSTRARRRRSPPSSPPRPRPRRWRC